MNMKRYVIAGGTGFIGRALSRHLTRLGYCVTVFSRAHVLNEERISYVKWSGTDPEEIQSYLEGADVLINLCGKSVDTRYTASEREQLYDSRLIPTRTLAQAVGRCENPPQVWLQMSTATIYADRLDGAWDEEGEKGTGFSVDLAAKWEDEFRKGIPDRVRGVIMRTAIVLGREGGAYPYYRALAKCGCRGFGGRNIRFSWIHLTDFCRAVVHLAHKSDFSGEVNLAADPCRMTDFMKYCSSRQGCYSIASMPSWLISAGSLVLRTEPELLLKSRSVRSSRLDRSGFEFLYSDMYSAVSQLESVKEREKQMVPKFDWMEARGG